MYAREAIKWTRNILNEEIKNVITELPLKITEGNVLYVHASPDDPMLWEYIVIRKQRESSKRLQYLRKVEQLSMSEV